MPNTIIKTVLIDDEARAINRMKLLLSHFEQLQVIEHFTDSEAGLKYVLKEEPQLVFVDIEMPELSGLEFASEVQKNLFDTKVVIVSSHEHYAIQAIKSQVFDYLLKPVSIDDLKNTIQRYKAEVLTNLSQREMEIVRAIADGLNSKAIGEKLFISRHTVDTYRRKILEKTQTKNAAELIRYAVKCGIVS